MRVMLRVVGLTLTHDPSSGCTAHCASTGLLARKQPPPAMIAADTNTIRLSPAKLAITSSKGAQSRLYGDRMAGEKILAHGDAQPRSIRHRNHSVLDRETFLDQVVQQRIGAERV